MKHTITALVIFLLILASCSLAQQDTAWQKWNWLIGEWVGEGNGVPGQGSGEFSLQPDLDGKVLIRRSHSEYPATKDKPLVVHDDLMIISPVSSSQPEKANYFDNEGHTIDYSATHTDSSIVFNSINPKMPLFRLTYVLLDKNTIDVIFEMSTDGQHYKKYTEGKCRRKV